MNVKEHIRPYLSLNHLDALLQKVKKKMEIRSWQPESLPLKDLVIVENKNYLIQDGDEEIGRAVAIIDIESIHP